MGAAGGARVVCPKAYVVCTQDPNSGCCSYFQHSQKKIKKTGLRVTEYFVEADGLLRVAPVVYIGGRGAHEVGGKSECMPRITKVAGTTQE